MQDAQHALDLLERAVAHRRDFVDRGHQIPVVIDVTDDRRANLPHQRIVISDLIPAIDGLLLEPVDDEEALAALIAEAEGRGPVQ